MSTTRLIRIAVLSAVLVVATGPSAVYAQSCEVERNAKVSTAAAAEDRLRTLNRNDCLGASQCESLVCKDVRPALDKPKPEAAEAAKALRDLTRHAGALAESSDPGTRLLTRLGIALARFVEDGRTAAAAWQMEDLRLFADEAYEINMPRLLQGCTGETECTKRFVEAQRIIELGTLVGRVLTKAKEANRNAFGANLDRLDQQWRAYLGSSRGQYPWELALNSALYRKTAAFDAPPVSQWIVAHPGAAYELTKNAPDRQPSESLLVEVAGVYRWKWAEDAKMRQRWGGSFTMAWRDAGETRNKLGWGVLVYLPRASTVGYVWRRQTGKDEHALVLSADLVKFLRGTEGLKERLIGAARGKP